MGDVAGPGPVSVPPRADESEEVVLVDDDDHELGRAGKLAAHRAPGRLHRAVSVFVFRTGGEVLLQRRAPGKYHFAGRWSNTCCGHPRPGESVVAAGRRRLVEELGIDCDLREVATLRYAAGDEASGLMEHELDHLLVGVSDATPQPHPAEVDAVRWARVAELVADLGADPDAYTPWLAPALALVTERDEPG